jgi:effector-binding domain-containing protein
MSNEIEIVEVQAQPAAIVRVKTGPQTIGEDQSRCFQQVMAFLRKNATQPAGPPLSFYFQIESETVWNIGAGFPVAARMDGDGTVEVVEIPAGRVATMLHAGWYDGLKDSWEAFEAWHKEQGYQIETELWCWESYLVGPDCEPEDSKWQTKLCWMLWVQPQKS